MPKAVYDGVNLNIDIPSVGGPVIEMDALEDFYEPWKDFLLHGQATGVMENKKFPQCWRPIAGDPITATSQYTGMIFLQNQHGWRLRLPDEDVTLVITGNLTLQDLTVPFHRARAGRTGSILGLAEFVTGVTNIPSLTEAAIFAHVMENGETFFQQQLLKRAEAAGDIVQQPDGSYVIKSADGLIDRITGDDAPDGGRTISATDPS